MTEDQIRALESVLAQLSESNAGAGGLLYDKWWVPAGVDAPEEDHPLWATQSTNERSGSSTWRCKECHGWDYQGAEGAYGSGSHFTGFSGAYAASTMSAAELAGWLTGAANADHDFSAYLDEGQINQLVAFIQNTLVDMTQFINDDKTATGDSIHGEELFATCVACHGEDGTSLNFGDETEPEYVGTIATGNPWEFFHKVKFGQPGTAMPAGLDLGWSTQDIADLLAYAQTLPLESTTGVGAGGLLYDKWWVPAGVDAPEEDHPLWATQSTNERSASSTWRCKECHGWDYQGAGGAYSSGSHYTGFPGIYNAAAMSTEDLVGWLTGAANADHDFSAYLDEGQIDQLVAFIQNTLVDMTQFINDDKTATGDSTHGEELFSACVACHGEDGTTLNFGDETEPEYVGTIATGNPWEFFHKVKFGQPGTAMPVGLALGWNVQDFVDLLTYAQTLPSE